MALNYRSAPPGHNDLLGEDPGPVGCSGGAGPTGALFAQEEPGRGYGPVPAQVPRGVRGLRGPLLARGEA